ncbi:MAG: putative LytR family transcriptional protein [Chloroflexi bacterium]|nr:putative LytR family transcriptional protein [Chloroflexota bacterium]
MQQDSAWSYGPNGLPVENIPVHNQPTLVMRPVPTERPRRRRVRFRVRTVIIAAILFLLLLFLGSGIVFWYYPPALGWVSQPFLPSASNVVPWNGSDPINILALGEDQRFPGAKTHSDTIIVISVDPGSGHVRMVSLPRDLAVSVPGYGEMSKINEGNYLGGPRYEAYTVEHALGIPINYYMVLRFQTFRKLIDALGGVDINVDQKINDPTYPALQGSGYAPLVLNPGMQHMDGATALAYVRERHAYTTGDEVRVQHQQQLITALKSQLMSPGTLFRLPSLVSAIQGALETNLPGNMLPVIAMHMARNGSMEHVYFSDTNGMVNQCIGYDNGADLCPTPAFWTKVHDLFQNPQLAAEHATVFVQNGSYLTGEAAAVAKTLTTSQFNVVGSGNADKNDHAHTAVIINSAQSGSAPYTARLLQQMFQARLLTRSMPDVHAQVVLLIGNDVPQIQ